MTTPIRYASATVADFPSMALPDAACDVQIRGPTGSGKTHLAYALARQWRIRPTLAMTAAAIAIDYQSALAGKHGMTGSEFVETLKTAGLLILDDLGASRIDERTQDVLLEVLNDREAWARPTIVTTNAGHGELPSRIEARLRGYMPLIVRGNDRRQDRRGAMPDASPANCIVPWQAHIDRWLGMAPEMRQHAYEMAQPVHRNWLPSRMINGSDVSGIERWGEAIAFILDAWDRLAATPIWTPGLRPD